MARMTYMGQCVINNKIMLCTQIEGGIQTNPQFYDHVVGLTDTNFNKTSPKGPGGEGLTQIQKKIYRFAPGVLRTNLSGVFTEDSIIELLDPAISGNTINQIFLVYYVRSPMPHYIIPIGHCFLDSVVESLTINVTAGEVISFNATIISKEYTETIEKKDSPPCVKLLTWDQCQITSSLPGDVASFSLTIKNNVIPIYVSGSNDPTGNYYPPTKLRLGIQEVTGNISTYDFLTFQSPPTDTIRMSLGNVIKNINVVYHPTSSVANGDVYISSTPFTGASDTSVWK